ncbi:MAG: DUF4402 domain-containing protein [Alphaproteobacteria bacterium]|nr:DUF4402 domain-containing protein [Alphaproteobacteria bacterium]
MITSVTPINFGTIAIDPSSGPQVVEVHDECPATWVCSGLFRRGNFLISGAPNTYIYLDLSGETAVLTDGAGTSIVFDPWFGPGAGDGDKATTITSPEGTRTVTPRGYMYFTGNEPAGSYSTQNAGGSPFTLTVNY